MTTRWYERTCTTMFHDYRYGSRVLPYLLLVRVIVVRTTVVLVVLLIEQVFVGGRFYIHHSNRTETHQGRSIMSTSSDASHKSLEPLERLLHSIVTRLEAIESKVGLETPQPSVRANDDADAPSVSPALGTYDAFLAKNIVPLLDTCTKLAVEDGKMKEIGERTQAAFESIRNIILLASLCQKPATTTAGIQTALAPHLKQIQVRLRTMLLDQCFSTISIE